MVGAIIVCVRVVHVRLSACVCFNMHARERVNCVKRDVKKAGEEEDWKKKTRARGGVEKTIR